MLGTGVAIYSSSVTLRRGQNKESPGPQYLMTGDETYLGRYCITVPYHTTIHTLTPHMG